MRPKHGTSFLTGRNVGFCTHVVLFLDIWGDYTPNRLAAILKCLYTLPYKRDFIFVAKYEHVCLLTTNYNRKRTISHI